MSKTNPRLISLEKLGGAKGLHEVPKRDRACVMASLMTEGPAKRESELKCASYAFAHSVEKGEFLRAKKLMGKHSLDSEKCREHVARHVQKLEAEGKSALANGFRITFDIGKARGAFYAEARAVLGSGFSSLNSGDYPSAFRNFNWVISQEEAHGVKVCTEKAALGLVLQRMRTRNFESAAETIRKYFMDENGRMPAHWQSAFASELSTMFGTVSFSYIKQIADIASRSGKLLEVGIEAVRMSLSKPPTEQYALRQHLELCLAFGMNPEAQEVAYKMISMLVAEAEANPRENFRNYRAAAEIAERAGIFDQSYELHLKHLVCCKEFGKDSLEIQLEGISAASAIVKWEEMASLGQSAREKMCASGQYMDARNLAFQLKSKPETERLEAIMGHLSRL